MSDVRAGLVLPSLKKAKLLVHYQAIEHVCFPQEAVSVWRGLVGRYMHRVSSLLNELFFETPRSVLRPVDHLSKRILGVLGVTGTHIPHPFILRCPSFTLQNPQRELAPGSTYTLELILVEDAIRFLPLLCAMFEDLGLSGVGKKTRQSGGRERRGRMLLTGAWLDINDVHHPLYNGVAWILPASVDRDIYDEIKPVYASRSSMAAAPQADLTVLLKSPLRITQKGVPVLPREMNPGLLAEGIWRRLCGLAICYMPEQPVEEDIWLARERIFELADTTEIDTRELHRQIRSRYSGRQKTTINTSGLVGRMTLKADPERIELWKSLLMQVEPFHVGKGTSFGQGWLSMLATIRTAATGRAMNYA